jgi:hypothetical protein
VYAVAGWTLIKADTPAAAWVAATKAVQVTAGSGQADAVRQRGVFAVDQDRALAELERAWADGGYHGFSVDDGTGRRSAARGTCSPGIPRTR